jgi:hypothetical protein
MRERNQGVDPGALAATSEYVALFGRKSLVAATEQLIRGALGAR